MHRGQLISAYFLRTPQGSFCFVGLYWSPPLNPKLRRMKYDFRLQEGVMTELCMAMVLKLPSRVQGAGLRILETRGSALP